MSNHSPLSLVSLVSFFAVASSIATGCADKAKVAEPPPSAPAPLTSGPGSPGVVAPGAATEIAVGKPAPDFSLKAHDGTDLSLSKLKGKPVVLYFYPRDETPGCTKEACSFRDAWQDLSKTGVVLIGVSTDTDESHKAFAEHHKLPFHLASDAKGDLAKAFGVPNRGGFLGRQSFVIGKDGNVKKIYRDVDVAKHAAEIKSDIEGG